MLQSKPQINDHALFNFFHLDLFNMTPEDLKQLEAKAEQGDSDAQYKLARTLPNWPDWPNESSYHTFPGDPFSNSRTEQLLERAADQGLVEAQTDLGVAYFLEKNIIKLIFGFILLEKTVPFQIAVTMVLATLTCALRVSSHIQGT